jgi:hypothetical protein
MEIAELYGSAPRSGRGGRRFKSCHSDQLLTTSMAYGASYGERNPTASLLGALITVLRSPRSIACILEGRRRAMRDIHKLYKEQRDAERRTKQLTLFDLKVDRRPVSR